MPAKTCNRVVTLNSHNEPSVRALVEESGLDFCLVDDTMTIPGSFWGEPEAGLIGRQLFVRRDTPLHSILHETCHYLCMDPARRDNLHTNAGGDYDEENAVCYLQILLSDQIEGFGQDRCMQDMDTWGYSFRLGSARAWFEQDAEDARDWLVGRGISDEG